MSESMSLTDQIYAHNVARQLAEMRAEDRADASSCSCPDTRLDEIDESVAAELALADQWGADAEASDAPSAPARTDAAGSDDVNDDEANVLAELEHEQNNAWG